MKLKLSKQTVTAIRTCLVLLILLMVVLQVRNRAQTQGAPVIENFLQTLGDETKPTPLVKP